MTYLQAAAFLGSFINYENKSDYPYRKSLGLSRIKGFLNLLGNPHKDLNCLHISGTKGKGSASAFLAYILREAGYKAGLYTSPHLSDLRERIRILSEPREHKGARARDNDFEGMISKREMAGLVKELRPLIEKYNHSFKSAALTFFEVLTALAFLYFKRKKVDYAVLETGLGGRLDATNVVMPLVCGITPISYDHIRQLGNSLKKIAAEKAGIIKRFQGSRAPGHRLIVISAPQEKEAREAIKKRCAEKKARLYEVGGDIAWKSRGFKKGARLFEVKGIKKKYNDLKIPLPGEYQMDNAALAVGMIEALRDERITQKAVREGLKKTIWPGRLEIISRNPFVIIDGAQNIASARALKEAVRKEFDFKKLILVLGISADKDIPGICREFYNFSDIIILTKSHNPRAGRPEDLAGYLKGKSILLTNSVKEAMQKAGKIAQRKDLILVTGSLFVAGEARKKVSGTFPPRTA